MRPNPFSVGSARPRDYMFGRSAEIRTIERIAFDVQGSVRGRRLCFLGAPGSGKTSVLKCAQNIFLSRNWLCGYSEASPDAATAIDEFIDDARRALPRGRDGERLRSRLTEISVSFAGVGAGIKLSDSSGPPSYARVRALFSALSEVAEKSDTGVALLIDEAQALPFRDLDLLLRAASRLDDSPVTIIMAGLPAIPGKLGGASDDRPTVSPIWFGDLSSLSASDSVQTLAYPIKKNGGIISEPALDRMAEFSEGHPLTLQMLGSSAWDFADHDLADEIPVLIEEEQAAKAIESTNRQLTKAYHEPMWARCNSSERRLLTKLALSRSRVVEYGSFMASARAEVPDADDTLYNLHGRGVVSIRESRLWFAIPGFRQFANYRL